LREGSESTPRALNEASLQKWLDLRSYAPWRQAVQHAPPVRVLADTARCGPYEKLATCLTNSQAVVKPMETVVSKAWEMVQAKAYLHHYERYGITEADMVDCIASLEQVVHNYKTL
jgi:tubulin delta